MKKYIYNLIGGSFQHILLKRDSLKRKTCASNYNKIVKEPGV